MAVGIFQGSFYKVKYVARGVARTSIGAVSGEAGRTCLLRRADSGRNDRKVQKVQNTLSGEVVSSPSRRKVLIATIEYNIDDWNIKVKIGGLGVHVSFYITCFLLKKRSY